jgi:hypothetical protein
MFGSLLEFILLRQRLKYVFMNLCYECTTTPRRMYQVCLHTEKLPEKRIHISEHEVPDFFHSTCELLVRIAPSVFLSAHELLCSTIHNELLGPFSMCKITTTKLLRDHIFLRWPESIVRIFRLLWAQ